MKKFALTIETFRSLGEVVETFDYLRTTFPGLLENSLDNYLSMKLASTEEATQRAKLAIIFAFNDFFESKSNNRGNSTFEHLYRESDGNTRQQILNEQFAIEANFLVSKGIDIPFCIAAGFIIEVKTITLTEQEKELILRTMKSRVLTADEILLQNSIIKKFN